MPDVSKFASLLTLVIRGHPGGGAKLTNPVSGNIALPSSLTKLDLSFNALTGTVPDLSSAALPQLVYIDLRNNVFDQSSRALLPVPNSKFNPGMQYLDISSCCPPTPTGSYVNVPTAALSGFTVLVHLGLDYILITGNTFPNLPTSLEYLSINYCSASGVGSPRRPLPAWTNAQFPNFDTYIKLEHLSLRGVKFTRAHPSSGQVFSRLKHLDLSFNSFSSGDIPAASSLNADLTYLALGGSNIRLTSVSPTLESYFSTLTRLQFLFLVNIPFKSVIPSVNAAAGLTLLDLTGCGLIGPIPDLSAFSALQYLKLEQNSFVSHLPPLNGLSSITYLSVLSANLYGPLPSFVGVTTLRTLLIGSNRLTGSIGKLAGASNLVTLGMQENAFTGPTTAFQSLQKLTSKLRRKFVGWGVVWWLFSQSPWMVRIQFYFAIEFRYNLFILGYNNMVLLGLYDRPGNYRSWGFWLFNQPDLQRVSWY
ncbi:hypothetical protein BDR26DRAFT_519856 [Obelidium mucronatum]|nr:hypothetical protein BDR26DRAFT_519856 [Obelidium mucronatum]